MGGRSLNAPRRAAWRLLLGVVVAAAIASLGAVSSAWAQVPVPANPDPTAPPRIIVVDFQLVLRESQAVASIEAQIAGLRDQFQIEFASIEEQLRDAETQLGEERLRLSAEEFRDRRRQFEQQVADAQIAAQQRRNALDQATESAMGVVRATLLEVVAEIANERAVQLVLSKPQVILVDRSLDVTDEALSRLDQRLASVDVVIGDIARPSQ